jgi:hypothetical protein
MAPPAWRNLKAPLQELLQRRNRSVSLSRTNPHRDSMTVAAISAQRADARIARRRVTTGGSGMEARPQQSTRRRQRMFHGVGTIHRPEHATRKCAPNAATSDVKLRSISDQVRDRRFSCNANHLTVIFTSFWYDPLRQAPNCVLLHWAYGTKPISPPSDEMRLSCMNEIARIARTDALNECEPPENSRTFTASVNGLQAGGSGSLFSGGAHPYPQG